MKKLLLLLAACATVAAGCKGGSKSAASGEAAGNAENVEIAPTGAPVAAGNDFTFDELFKIFSCFGDNVMTKAYAAQSTKDGIKDELADEYEGRTEFTGETNVLSHSFYNEGCSEDFQMACYRYKADGHVLVMLLETGGCDVTSIRYIRAYDYNPETNDAHEIDLPFSPKPTRGDFEDMVRLAGTDLSSLRDAMQKQQYLYEFRLNGVKVRLNDPTDFDEQVYHGDLVVDYLWDGSEFVRNGDYRYACIHPDGFASIKLGEPAPDFRFDYDPKGYDAVYSSGGDLWNISLGGDDVLQVQMDGGKVYSIETWSPKYCVASYTYDPGVDKVQPYVGGLIKDCVNLVEEGTEVRMLMDGTVQIECPTWNSKLAFRTSQDALATGDKPSMDGPYTIANPKFKPTAKIESIYLWRE